MCCDATTPPNLLSSSRRLVRNKKITIETEEKLSLLVQFGEFSKPTVRLFQGYAFAPSRNGTLWNVGSDHSGLMLANLITVAHFATSAVMKV